MPSTRVRFSWILLLTLPAAGLLIAVGWRPVHSSPQSIPAVAGTTPPSQWSAALNRSRQLVREEIARQNVPGLSVAVGHNGALLWSEGFGFAHLATGVPVTPTTRFRIGSGSIPLTSAAIGLLLDSGKLNLDRDIRDTLPQFPEKQWPVSLRHLLANTAGLGSESEEDRPLDYQRCENAAAALPRIVQKPLLSQPGTRYRPSNYGWVVASAVIESAAQQPFVEFLQEKLLQPLGMADTGAEPSSKENPDGVGEEGEDAPIFTFVRQVVLKPLGVVKDAPPPEALPSLIYLSGFGPNPNVAYGLHQLRVGNLSCYAGSKALFSTPSDIVRFGSALQTAKILRAETTKTLQSPQRLASGQETRYGLGWELDTTVLPNQSTPWAGYDGELRGHRLMSFRMSRDSRIVVAVMANSPSADTAALTRRIAALFAEAVR